jgi:hypothetical protein
MLTQEEYDTLRTAEDAGTLPCTPTLPLCGKARAVRAWANAQHEWFCSMKRVVGKHVAWQLLLEQVSEDLYTAFAQAPELVDVPALLAGKLPSDSYVWSALWAVYDSE